MTTNSLFYDYLEQSYRQSNAGPRDITHIYAYRPNREDGGALLFRTISSNLTYDMPCSNTLCAVLLFRTIWNKPLLLPSMYIYVSCAPSSTNKEIYLSLEYLVSRPSPNHSIDAYWRVLGYPESKPTITYWQHLGVSGHIAYNPLLHPSSLAETPPDAYAVDLSEDNKKTILTVGYSTASNL